MGSPPPVDKTKRLSRWYFGGLASAGAACCTHPLDLLKVHLQTQQEKGGHTLLSMGKKVVRDDGFLRLWNGLSASLVRQLTYSTTRFGMYETLKKQYPPDQPLPFYMKVLLAAVSGACGGWVGTPGDMVNVRMQNDMKLAPELRRNYKHALDGLYRVYSQEGVKTLFSGATMATSRAVLMTVGQLSFYDQFKQLLLASGYFGDNLVTHFTASTMASTVATTMTQPLDVMKTRMMNAKPGEFKGYIPAFVRLAPQTILTFVFFEQLRQNFGFFRSEVSQKI